MPSPEFFTDLAQQLDNVQHGGKGALIQQAIVVCGSRAAVYRGLQDLAAWTSGRKKRADMGKSVITKEQAVKTMAYVTACDRKNGKQILPLNQAVADLIANGILPEDVSVSTVRRALESHGITPKQMRIAPPSQPLRSAHPNHVHQIDPSVCTLWFFKQQAQKGATFQWSSENEFYKNKPWNEDDKRRGMIWRYVLTDHTTGYIGLHYIQAAGEGFINYFEALMHFWGRKDFSPFHGVPKYLMSDRIGAMKTSEMKSLLSALEVEHIVAQSARAKGQVEVSNNVVETRFEYMLRGMQVENIQHLNELAHDWEYWFNNTQIHTRHHQPRLTMWEKHIREEHIFNLPSVDLCRLYIKPRAELRTVTEDLAIEFAVPNVGKHSYRLRHIKGLNIKDKVKVQPHPFEYPSIWVTVTDRTGIETRHIVKPIEINDFGFDAKAALIGDEHIQVMPDTERDILRKQAQKMAYGVETQAEADKARKENKPIFQGKIDTMKQVKDTPKVQHLPRRGMEIKTAVIESRNNPTETMSALSNALNRPLTRAEGLDLTTRYPSGCTDTEIAALVAAFSHAPIKLQAV
jgi:hypothetical protein